MSDLISRQEAINVINKYADRDITSTEKAVACDYCIELLKNLPSEQQWIPCNEKLSEFGVKVLVCNANGDIYSDYIIETPHGKKIWCEASAYDVYDIVAWMPIPEPYKEK